MSFVHQKKKKKMTVSAPIPEDMQEVVKLYFSNNEISVI